MRVAHLDPDVKSKDESKDGNEVFSKVKNIIQVKKLIDELGTQVEKVLPPKPSWVSLMIAEEKVDPLPFWANIRRGIKSRVPRLKKTVEEAQHRRGTIKEKVTRAVVKVVTVGVDLDWISISILMLMILMDFLWIFAFVGSDPIQGGLAFAAVWVLLYSPLYLIVYFNAPRSLYPLRASFYILPVSLPSVILFGVVKVYFEDNDYKLAIMSAINWVTHLALWFYCLILKFKLSVQIKYSIALITFLCISYPPLHYVTLHHTLFLPAIISSMETFVIVCTYRAASTKKGNNEISMVFVYTTWSVQFETFRFLGFLEFIHMYFLDPQEGLLELLLNMMLNILFQAYGQTDLCFYINDKLQNMTGTNENGSLPRLAFALLIGAAEGIIPLQEMVGDSKELESATRLYYAFVWSTTFRIPTLFTMQVLLNKMYGTKGSLSYENLVSNWGYVMIIYWTQEFLAEILCRFVDFVLSKKYIDYHGRFSYPKVMFKHYQKHGIYVCVALQLFGATWAYQGMKLFSRMT